MLTLQVGQHGAIIYSVYIAVAVSGLAPAKYDLARLGVVVLMHFVPHLLVVLPLFLCTTKEEEEEDEGVVVEKKDE